MAKRLRQTMKTVPGAGRGRCQWHFKRTSLVSRPELRRVDLPDEVTIEGSEPRRVFVRPRSPVLVFYPREEPTEEDFLPFEHPCPPETPQSLRRHRLFRYGGMGTVVVGVMIVWMAAWRTETPEALPLLIAAPAPKPLADDYVQVAQMFGEFLRAPTLTERLKYVRHPRRVGPLMERYYEKHPSSYPLVRRITKTSGILLGSGDFLTMQFELADFSSAGIITERTEHGPKLDWESFVAHGSVSWSQFLTDKPRTLERLRVFVSLVEGEHFVDDYDTFLIEHPSSTEVAYAYFRQSKENAALGKQLKRVLMDEPRSPFILQLTYATVGTLDLIEIVEVEQNQWIDLRED